MRTEVNLRLYSHNYDFLQLMVVWKGRAHISERTYSLAIKCNWNSHWRDFHCLEH